MSVLIVKIATTINVPELPEERVNSMAFLFQNIQPQVRKLGFFKGSVGRNGTVDCFDKPFKIISIPIAYFGRSQ